MGVIVTLSILISPTTQKRVRPTAPDRHLVGAEVETGRFKPI
jgi:hypothetical protein